MVTYRVMVTIVITYMIVMDDLSISIFISDLDTFSRLRSCTFYCEFIVNVHIYYKYYIVIIYSHA